jgi:hypothetical protein
MTAADWFRPEGAIRQALPNMVRDARLALFDQAYGLAEKAECPDTERRERIDLFNFAWRLNDIVVEFHRRLDKRIAGRVPHGGLWLAKARARRRVPVQIGAIHVSLALKFAYKLAAPGACVVIEPRLDFEIYDLRFLAGLNVEILATANDLWFGDALAHCLAADGAHMVTMRRLDINGRPSETLYNGGRRWGA